MGAVRAHAQKLPCIGWIAVLSAAYKSMPNVTKRCSFANQNSIGAFVLAELKQFNTLN
jgi:hypothetical protein